jgi:U3 small nucleolar RNA-associated protein 3
MGKGKKKRSKSGSSSKEDRTIQSKLAQWNTLDDIEGDSQDEFHSQRAKVLLQEEVAPAYYGSSGDEGVLELSSASEEEDEEDEEEEDDLEEFEREEALVKNLTRNLPSGGHESDEQDDEMAEDGEEGWGTSARAYYDADQDSQDDEMGMLF